MIMAENHFQLQPPCYMNFCECFGLLCLMNMCAAYDTRSINTWMYICLTLKFAFTTRDRLLQHGISVFTYIELNAFAIAENKYVWTTHLHFLSR